MADLSEQIRAKQLRITELETELLGLRKELDAAKRLLLGPAHVSSVLMAPRRRGNSTEWAESVLRKRGMPMHVNEIISEIERDFEESVRYATLVGNIARLVKKGRVFQRMGPNIFGLITWTADARDDASEADDERERSNRRHEFGLEN